MTLLPWLLDDARKWFLSGMIESMQHISFPADGVHRLLVVRVGGNSDRHDVYDTMRVALRDKLPKETIIAVMPAELQIELLDEEMMREYGWVRAPA